jgi:two-component system CheB/CheR fusion protein
MNAAPIRPYLVAISFVLIAWLLQAVVGPYFGEIFAYIPFFVAATFVSFIEGFRPALLATALGYLIASYFYASPGSLLSFDEDNVVALTLYVVLSVMIGWLAESLHQTRRKAEALAETLRVDIDRRQEIEEALRDADRRKNEFLAMLAHELRNPLAAIQYAVNLSALPGVTRDGFDWSEAIVRQVQHLARLVDDLLDVSRIMQGQIRLQREPVDAAVVIRQAAESLRVAIEEKQHVLTLDLPSDSLPLFVDPIRLEQVFQNLLNNATKFTKRGGRIHITGQADAEDAVITIADTGIGMPEDLIPRVFDLFTQGDRSLDRSQGGLGIGLTLVRQITEMHNGSVSATSEGIGRGSTFTVRLPLATQAGSKPIESQELATKNGTSKRILVIEDNLAVAQTLGLLLKSDRHKVELCHSGTAALETAQCFLPDVVLLDIGLPGKDGFQVAREIRSDERLRDSRIIALSGYGQDTDRQTARAAGCDEHLVKPVDFQHLRLMIGMGPNSE